MKKSIFFLIIQTLLNAVVSTAKDILSNFKNDPKVGVEEGKKEEEQLPYFLTDYDNKPTYANTIYQDSYPLSDKDLEKNGYPQSPACYVGSSLQELYTCRTIEEQLKIFATFAIRNFFPDYLQPYYGFYTISLKTIQHYFKVNSKEELLQALCRLGLGRKIFINSITILITSDIPTAISYGKLTFNDYSPTTKDLSSVNITIDPRAFCPYPLQPEKNLKIIPMDLATLKSKIPLKKQTIYYIESETTVIITDIFGVPIRELTGEQALQVIQYKGKINAEILAEIAQIVLTYSHDTFLNILSKEFSFLQEWHSKSTMPYYKLLKTHSNYKLLNSIKKAIQDLYTAPNLHSHINFFKKDLENLHKEKKISFLYHNSPENPVYIYSEIYLEVFNLLVRKNKIIKLNTKRTTFNDKKCIKSIKATLKEAVTRNLGDTCEARYPYEFKKLKDRTNCITPELLYLPSCAQDITAILELEIIDSNPSLQDLMELFLVSLKLNLRELEQNLITLQQAFIIPYLNAETPLLMLSYIHASFLYQQKENTDDLLTLWINTLKKEMPNQQQESITSLSEESNKRLQILHQGLVVYLHEILIGNSGFAGYLQDKKIIQEVLLLPIHHFSETNTNEEKEDNVLSILPSKYLIRIGNWAFFKKYAKDTKTIYLNATKKHNNQINDNDDVCPDMTPYQKLTISPQNLF